MRVLWLVRENLERHPGGDTVQIVETARALRAMGVQVDFSAEPRANLAGYDAVHLFHLDRLWENEAHARRIRTVGIPAVLSPIYWPAEEFDRGGRTGLQGLMARALGSEAYRTLRLFQRWALQRALDPRPSRWTRPPGRFRRSVEALLGAVRVLLPNSRAEAEHIRAYSGIESRFVVVPNAARADIYRPPGRPWPEGRSGVLCVGRIEPRKNQLMLIRALRGTGAPLTLVGRAGRFSERYYRQCASEAGDDVRFLDFRSPAELSDLYGRALVHACVSWYETPGLVNLEAALCGCAVVATPGGCTREYLAEGACYCVPGSAASIRQAIEAALKCGPSAALAGRVAREFTWEEAAKRTLEGYGLAVAAPT